MQSKEKEQEASELCQSCGLCCYAFHNLGLVQNEKEKQIVEGFGGELFTNKAGKLSFRQPCPAYDGKCSVYPDHPLSCRQYRCKLLDTLLKGERTFNEARRIVEKTKQEVETIDTSLLPLLGERSIIVDEYINLFFETVKNDDLLKKRYQNALIHFGIYKHYRSNYFDRQ